MRLLRAVSTWVLNSSGVEIPHLSRPPFQYFTTFTVKITFIIPSWNFPSIFLYHLSFLLPLSRIEKGLALLSLHPPISCRQQSNLPSAFLSQGWTNPVLFSQKEVTHWFDSSSVFQFLFLIMNGTGPACKYYPHGVGRTPSQVFQLGYSEIGS